jgi:hypothetical protein
VYDGGIARAWARVAIVGPFRAQEWLLSNQFGARNVAPAAPASPILQAAVISSSTAPPCRSADHRG